MAPPKVLAKGRGYYDEQGIRWLTVTEATYVYNRMALFPISDATWRRRCRSGNWADLGIRVEEPMPGYWMTDSQTLYEFLNAHNKEVGQAGAPGARDDPGAAGVLRGGQGALTRRWRREGRERLHCGRRARERLHTGVATTHADLRPPGGRPRRPASACAAVPRYLPQCETRPRPSAPAAKRALAPIR